MVLIPPFLGPQKCRGLSQGILLYNEGMRIESVWWKKLPRADKIKKEEGWEEKVSQSGDGMIETG